MLSWKICGLVAWISGGLGIGDTVGAIWGFSAIMAALYYREKTGEGQFIEFYRTWRELKEGAFSKLMAFLDKGAIERGEEFVAPSSSVRFKLL